MDNEIACSFIVLISGDQSADDLARRLREIADTEQQRCEIIFICDDPDRARPIRELVSRDDAVRLVELTAPVGVAGAMLAGIDHASGRAAVCLGDTSAPTLAMVEPMLQRWQSGAEVIAGPGYSRPVADSAGRTQAAVVKRLVGQDPRADESACLFDRCTFSLLRRLGAVEPTLTDAVSRAGFSVARLPGELPTTIKPLSRPALNDRCIAMLSRSRSPIRWCWRLGVIAAAVTIVATLAVLLTGRLVSSLLILLLGGAASANLLAGALLGEYLVRLGCIHSGVGPYVVRRRAGFIPAATEPPAPARPRRDPPQRFSVMT